MNPWMRLVRVLRSLGGGGPVHRDLDAEVASYLEMLVDEKVASGLTPEEALREARIELGGGERVKEEVRAARPAVWLDTLARDLRGGIRQLAKIPAFSLTIFLILTLGIGANVAVFGLVNLLLLQPRVGADQPGQPVSIHVHDPKVPASWRVFSYPEYEDIRQHATVFNHVAAHRNVRVVVSDGELSRSAVASEVTASYFAALGARLSAGRTFTTDEERPGSGAAVAVINHDTWLALGAGPSVLGRTIMVNGHPFAVVGVAPEGFSGTLVAFGPLLWIPLGADGIIDGDDATPAGPVAQPARPTRNLLLVGRLRPRVAIDAANAALEILSPRLQLTHPDAGSREVLVVSRLARTQDGDAPGTDSGLWVPLGALTAMAALLLVVASLNVANMQLARGASRRGEIAMRLALGAGRGRVMSQLLVEGLMLSLAGGAGGLLAGVWTLKLAAASFTPVIDEWKTITIAPDIRVVLATAAFCVLSAALFAIGPSLTLSRLNVLSQLKGARGNDEGAGIDRHAGPRGLLVAWQVALSLALLATAGLFARGAVAAGQADPGYRLDGQVLGRVDATGSVGAQGREAFRDLLERIRATRGVESATTASLVAFGNEHSSRRVLRAGAAAALPGAAVFAQSFTVGAAYFRTLGLPVLVGREFTLSEEQATGDAHIVIIDEPLARALFPGGDPVGRHIAFPASRNGRAAETLEIVGLVAGQRDRLTDPAPVPHVYLPMGSHYQAQISIHVRLSSDGRADVPGVLRRVRDAIRASAPRLALLGLSTLEEARDQSPQNWLVRAAGVTFGALGVVGLAMAVIGLYGVKAYLVSRRAREIGIRMALGATPRGVIAMVIADGAWLIVAGVVVGFLIALGAGYLVSSLLVGVHPLDPLVFALATVVLVAAIAAASYVPARRATRIDPALAFRSE